MEAVRLIDNNFACKYPAMNNVTTDQTKNNWYYRRLIIFCKLIFNAGLISYITFWATSTPLLEQIAIATFASDSLLISGYVFGAILDDYNLNKINKESDASQ
jgi:hypothetical protein